jgi:hypothetical protein
MSFFGTGINFNFAAGDAEFVPTGSPVAHFSADTIVGLNDGDRIQTWSDQTVNGNDLVQSTENIRPLYKTGIQNGLPAVHLATVSDIMSIAALSMTQANSIFIAFKVIATGAGLELFDGGAARQIVKQKSFDTVWQYYAGSFVDSLTAVDTNNHVLAIQFNGASSTFRLDGVEIVSGNPGAGGSIGFTLGRGGASTITSYIYEIILYDSAESTSANETGLMSKWGIS